jgi:hypothetical protein
MQHNGCVLWDEGSFVFSLDESDIEVSHPLEPLPRPLEMEILHRTGSPRESRSKLNAKSRVFVPGRFMSMACAHGLITASTASGAGGFTNASTASGCTLDMEETMSIASDAATVSTVSGLELQLDVILGPTAKEVERWNFKEDNQNVKPQNIGVNCSRGPGTSRHPQQAASAAAALKFQASRERRSGVPRKQGKVDTSLPAVGGTTVTKKCEPCRAGPLPPTATSDVKKFLVSSPADSFEVLAHARNVTSPIFESNAPSDRRQLWNALAIEPVRGFKSKTAVLDRLQIVYQHENEAHV